MLSIGIRRSNQKGYLPSPMRDFKEKVRSLGSGGSERTVFKKVDSD